MITSLLIYASAPIIMLILSPFSLGGGLPQPLHDAAIFLGSYSHILDPLIPFSTLLTCVLLIFGVEIALLGFRFFRWLWSHVPVVGGRGNK